MVLYKQQPDPVPVTPAPRKKPGELGLDLSASVLRLPYPPGTRLVLAEIISLHLSSARGCDASDQHFANRLGISKNKAGTAITELFDAKLIGKTVDKEAGFYRVLVPRFDAIDAAAKLNPYPNFQGSPTPKIGVAPPTPKIGVAYPKNEGSPSPEIGVALPQKLGTNTSVNLSPNPSLIPQSESLPSAALCGGGEEKKIGPEDSENQSLTKSAQKRADTNSADNELVTTKSASKKSRVGRAAAPAPAKAAALPESCPLAELLNEGGDAARVQLLAEPLTEKQAGALLNEFSEAALRDIFCQMANWGKLLTPSGATSANLTARNWLKKRSDAKKTEQDGSANNLPNGRVPAPGAQYRSQNGAKPTANAGAFARALAERRGE